MIRQFTRLTFSAAVIVLLALLAPDSMARQVGVKAEPPNKAPAKKNAPPSKVTKPPVTTRPPPRASIVVPAHPVLSRIEKYKAPVFPKSGPIDRETYDYRIKNRVPVPATLTDVLVCDIWQRVTMDLKLSPNPQEISEATVQQGMNVYFTKPWRDIAGYRPWTHWNFIRSLSEADRRTLAKEIADYIKKNGVRDVKQ